MGVGDRERVGPGEGAKSETDGVASFSVRSLALEVLRIVRGAVSDRTRGGAGEAER